METTIVSDRLTDGVEEHGVEDRIPDEITVKDWKKFSPNSISAEHLVLDLNFINLIDDEEFSDLPLNHLYRGKNKKIAEIDNNEDELLDIFESLAWTDVIPNFLSTGGSLTVLYSDLLKIETASDRSQTLSWLYQHGLLSRTKPIQEAKFSESGISDFEIVSDLAAIDDYFKFVDGYTHTLDFEGGDDDVQYEFVGGDLDPIAKSREGQLIAARLSRFMNASGEIQELGGNLTFLPQPTRLNPRIQDLITSLAAIGFEGGDNKAAEPPAYGLPSGSSDLPELVSEDVRKKLQGMKHGEEVLKQIEDGDACVENDLWQPALGSYIHAIEWAFIAYLEDRQGVDVIAKEQQGGVYYNLAGGHHSLLDEVTNYASLDQKTVSSIRSMNQAQRRWMAHHKSGKTLGHDVMSLRSRLGTILDELFS